MNANLQRKHEIVSEVKNRFEWANLAVLAQYRGVNVAGMSDLRKQARHTNVEIRVVKNTLAKRAVEETEFECLRDSFEGPLAIALSNDPVAAAKLISEFSKKNEKFKFQAGAMNGVMMDADQFKQIATLPSREELLAKLVGTAASPISSLLGVLSQIPASLVRTLSAVRDQKSTAEEYT